MVVADEKSAEEQRRPQIVALTGFMGSGKTTAGCALAELLGWAFLDLDEVIEQREGVTVREIFAQRGEAEFRTVESAALRRLSAGCASPTVVALGGGTFVQPENAEVLRTAGVRTVFLELPLDVMMARCAEQDSQIAENVRPLAKDAAAFRRLYEERLPFYRRAELELSAHEKSALDIAREIAERLQL